MATITNQYPDHNDEDYQDGKGLLEYFINTQVNIQPFGSGASVVSIPLLHILFVYLKRQTRFRPSIMWRIVGGHITMMVGCIFCLIHSMVTERIEDGTKHEPFLYIAVIFLGLTNALVYTAGYELALLFSSRASSCLAIGVFTMVDGLSMLFVLPLTYSVLTIYPNAVQILSYIVLLAYAVVLLLVCNKKLNLKLEV